MFIDNDDVDLDEKKELKVNVPLRAKKRLKSAKMAYGVTLSELVERLIMSDELETVLEEALEEKAENADADAAS